MTERNETTEALQEEAAVLAKVLVEYPEARSKRGQERLAEINAELARRDA